MALLKFNNIIWWNPLINRALLQRFSRFLKMLGRWLELTFVHNGLLSGIHQVLE